MSLLRKEKKTELPKNKVLTSKKVIPSDEVNKGTRTYVV